MQLTAEDIERMADQTDLGYHPYSGRGMFGRECPSVYAQSFQELSQLIAECDSVEQAAWLLEYARTDSMGRGIVIYWPSIRLERDEGAEQRSPHALPGVTKREEIK